MLKAISSYAGLVGAYTRINLKTQMEYRGAFFSQVLAMFVNDGAWVAFWIFFFRSFPVVRGWELVDVLSLWAIVTAGFGVAYAVMGNALQLAPIIVQGDLDLWLCHPRRVLPHLVLGRSVPSAWGDAAFGYAVYFGFVRPDPAHMAMFAALTAVVAVTFVGLGILGGSLAFYVGSASGLADEWRNTVISFSTYPPPLFQGGVKLLLYTAIPAGFVSYVPVEALRSLSAAYFLLSAGGALAVLGAGIAAFHFGLLRYESGNLISTNG